MRNNWLTFIVGAGVGAGLMYYFDPRCGRRRRSMARERMVAVGHRTSRYLDRTWKHTRNRMRGMMAETAARMRQEETSDEVLVNRVRSKMGRVVKSPSAIEVCVHEGCVELKGEVRAAEVEELIATVRNVPGVATVKNHLDIYTHTGSQGGAED